MKRVRFSLISLFALLLLGFAGGYQLQAQSPDIEIQIQAEPVLTNAQIIELSNLAFNEEGTGSRLFNIFIQNNSAVQAENLYLDLILRSQSRGVIVEAFQSNNRPFSMNAGQTIFATNNDIAQRRLPGISEDVSFSGNLTNSGKQLVNDLRGRASLPAGEYIIEVGIYQENNRPAGGRLLASASVTIGSQTHDDDLAIFLQAPGEMVGIDVVITNPYPEFRWEGSEDRTYRLIVVEDREGESPETLIQSAKSTSPAQRGGSTDLLEFEMVDLNVEGPRLQFPSSGVQPLENGKRYYWQVFTTLQTTSGQEERVSEIWNFRLSDGMQTTELVEIEDDVRQMLISILGIEVVEELERNNFSLEGLDVDEDEFDGNVARDQLIRLIERIRDGKAKISKE